ncbi:MAG: hypothetical protein Q8K60_08340, partial [Parachlamydiaceae bacterium]|nr:hypothetical protein [Parachlamydiaceae bacterium]
IKGCVRMVDEPAQSEFGFGKYRGIWLEVVQEYKRPLFSLKTTFLGLNGWDSVVFSFFVRAKQCVIGNDKTLFPNTLEHYEGEVQSIYFHGKEIKVGLNSIGHNGKLQVIPLSGGNNFWGANFLVAYQLTNDQSHYEWQVK